MDNERVARELVKLAKSLTSAAYTGVTKKELEEAWFAVMEAKGVLGRVTYPQMKPSAERAAMKAEKLIKQLVDEMGKMVMGWTDK